MRSALRWTPEPSTLPLALGCGRCWCCPSVESLCPPLCLRDDIVCDCHSMRCLGVLRRRDNYAYSCGTSVDEGDRARRHSAHSVTRSIDGQGLEGKRDGAGDCFPFCGVGICNGHDGNIWSALHQLAGSSFETSIPLLQELGFVGGI